MVSDKTKEPRGQVVNGVIVEPLGVKDHTREIVGLFDIADAHNMLVAAFDRASDERDNLRTSLTTALAERDALHVKYVDAATECTAWKMACTLAKEERDGATALLSEILDIAQQADKGIEDEGGQAIRRIAEKAREGVGNG